MNLIIECVLVGIYCVFIYFFLYSFKNNTQTLLLLAGFIKHLFGYLLGFQQFDFRQIDANINDICNIIKSHIDPRYPIEPSVIVNKQSFGGNKRKTNTKRRRYRNVTKRLKTKRKTERKRKTKSRK